MKKKSEIVSTLSFSMNPKKYIYLYEKKLHKAFLYILILALVLGFIQGIANVTLLSIVEKASEKALNEQELTFELKDGVLDFKSSPLKEEEGETLLLIDTNKEIKDLQELKSITVHKKSAVVFLKDGFMIKNNSEEVNHKYSDFALDKIYLDNNVLIDSMKYLKYVKYIVIPVGMVLQFIDLIFYGLLISIVGVLSNLLNKTQMKYTDIFKLSLYSVTLPSLINLIIPIGSFVIFVGGLILVFGMGYINMMKKEAN